MNYEEMVKMAYEDIIGEFEKEAANALSLKLKTPAGQSSVMKYFQNTRHNGSTGYNHIIERGMGRLNNATKMTQQAAPGLVGARNSALNASKAFAKSPSSPTALQNSVSAGQALQGAQTTMQNAAGGVRSATKNIMSELTPNALSGGQHRLHDKINNRAIAKDPTYMPQRNSKYWSNI